MNAQRTGPWTSPLESGVPVPMSSAHLNYVEVPTGCVERRIDDRAVNDE